MIFIRGSLSYAKCRARCGHTQGFPKSVGASQGRKSNGLTSLRSSNLTNKGFWLDLARSGQSIPAQNPLRQFTTLPASVTSVEFTPFIDKHPFDAARERSQRSLTLP